MVLLSAANRTIRKSVKGGEKKRKDASGRCNRRGDQDGEKEAKLSELPAATKTAIEEKVKALAAKK